MRDVAVIGFAQVISARERERNEVELIIPAVRGALADAGIARSEVDFTISGSCDYLSGGPFTFVSGLDAAGAWPPVKESHVEMDAAWALYEAWVAIQTGDVDSALIYGFGKSSLGDLHEIMTLQTDPYTVAPLWPSMVDLAALQASVFLAATGRSDAELAAVAARSRRAALANPYAVAAEDVAEDALLARPVTHAPLRDADIAPITDGAAAMIIAVRDVAERHCERPAYLRGIEHRVDPQGLGLRDLTTSTSATLAAHAAGVADGPVEVAELHAQFSHEELILREALGLGDDVEVNPSGGALGANPVMATGLIRIGEVATRIRSGAVRRGVAHAAQGPCLQQNLVCVLEADR
ncbi:MAG: lipid-transfer protein [Actinobacteria bacterium]|nr:lipid-transfer protein [Actinomycetota bacterium]